MRFKGRAHEVLKSWLRPCSGWDLGQDGKLWNGRNGRSGKWSHSSGVIGACICSNDVNVCGSAHCGWVNGSVAMAAF